MVGFKQRPRTVSWKAMTYTHTLSGFLICKGQPVVPHFKGVVLIVEDSKLSNCHIHETSLALLLLCDIESMIMLEVAVNSEKPLR